jgi:hypothetical protein
MTTDQEIMEEASMIKDEEPMETMNDDSVKTEHPKPSWFAHQVIKYLLPALKD